MSKPPHTHSQQPQQPQLKLETLTFRNKEPAQPIRFEFGPNKETFTLDIPAGDESSPGRRQTWWQWKSRAYEHPQVRAWFKSNVALYPSDFALRVGSEWIGPDSAKDDVFAETEVLLRAGGARTAASIVLLYAPRIHLCTFDGIQFSISCFGHWLTASDNKTLAKLKSNAPPDASTQCPNNLLLGEPNEAEFARVLSRVASFMKDELALAGDQYVISVPFGGWIFADGDERGKDEVRARVQIQDARVFWTLVLKFEDKLNDDVPARRIEYMVHQRAYWVDARFTDYKRWAQQEAASVNAALEALEPPSHNTAGSHFKLPKNFVWDEYGRMQLCHKMTSAIADMLGNLGVMSPKLKLAVRAVQNAAQSMGSNTINLSAQGDQCFVLFPADRYINILTRANADARAWGVALIMALQDNPERLYSGLLLETGGLVSCTKEDLTRLDDALRALAPRPRGQKSLTPFVDTSILPLSADIISNLEGRNNTDKRLFLERFPVLLDAKLAAAGGGSSSSPLPSTATLGAAASPNAASSLIASAASARPKEPTIWDKKRAGTGGAGTQASAPSSLGVVMVVEERIEPVVVVPQKPVAMSMQYQQVEVQKYQEQQERERKEHEAKQALADGRPPPPSVFAKSTMASQFAQQPMQQQPMQPTMVLQRSKPPTVLDGSAAGSGSAGTMPAGARPMPPQAAVLSSSSSALGRAPPPKAIPTTARQPPRAGLENAVQVMPRLTPNNSLIKPPQELQQQQRRAPNNPSLGDQQQDWRSKPAAPLPSLVANPAAAAEGSMDTARAPPRAVSTFEKKAQQQQPKKPEGPPPVVDREDRGYESLVINPAAPPVASSSDSNNNNNSNRNRGRNSSYNSNGARRGGSGGGGGGGRGGGGNRSHHSSNMMHDPPATTSTPNM